MNRRFIAIFVCLLVIGGSAGAQETAQQQMRDGTVIIGAGEVIDDDVEIQAATVIINGTVNGDVSFFAGTVYIPGQVNGNVDGYAGNIQIDGTISGDTSLFAGNIVLGPKSTVGGDLVAGGGNVYLRGSVNKSATVTGASVELASTATVGGDLRYEADQFTNNGNVAGSIIEDVGDTFDTDISVPSLPSGAFPTYNILVNAVFGLLLLFGLPRLTKRVRDRADDHPFRSIGIGLGALIGVPFALVLLMFTIIGIPIAIVGLGLVILAAWMGSVYGKYLIGVWILEQIDIKHEPAAVITGVIAVGALATVPVFGTLFDFTVLLFGLGLLLRVWFGNQPRYSDVDL